MSSEPRWLTEDEQRSWRAYLEGSIRLHAYLEETLKAQTDLTMDDYEVLVYLSESPERRMRMSDVAARVLSSRSKLSYRVDRLEQRGLLRRVPCENDGRAIWAELTDTGYALLVHLAPAHVESVRWALVDRLEPEEFASLGQAMAKIGQALRDR
jgi:DNA-binding MarR family transcriptional regulator